MNVEGGQGQRIPRLAVVNIEMSAGDFKNGNISRELGRLRICLLMEGNVPTASRFENMAK
jgi:hypothetical protein